MKKIKISKYEMNYMKDDGTYLLDDHVYRCYDFNNGFGLVGYNDDTYNYINFDGKKLLKTNVYHCLSFHNRFTNILINNNWYKIDTESNFYSYKDKVSFKTLYNEYPNMRSELIEIIDKYTYFNVEEYFI